MNKQQQPTQQHPLVTIEITPRSTYRAVCSNGLGTSYSESIRPGSAISGALRDLRMDYPNTATVATVTRASLHVDDVAVWEGRAVSCIGGR